MTSTSDKKTRLLKYWHEIQPLINQGYRLLDKEVIMNLPGPCMPCFSESENIGIGSPYGKGAARVWAFFDKSVDKILLGPSGRVKKESSYSPYMSETELNPFFIPPEFLVERKLIMQKTLDNYYRLPKNPQETDYELVEKTFALLLHRAWKNSHSQLSEGAFIQELTKQAFQSTDYPYIGDMQIQVPYSVVQAHPEAFLTDFTLGTDGDSFCPKGSNWGFAFFHPKKLFTKDGLGIAGRIWKDLLSDTLVGAKAGVRIDHFIAYVNPYLFSLNPKIPNGRLFSSPYHPILKKYAYQQEEDFYRIIDKILLPVCRENHLEVMQIYAEDIGARPPQMEKVMRHFGLGRLLVSQFKVPSCPTHLYQINRAKYEDVVALDTHDLPSVQMFFDSLNDNQRFQHAINMAGSLRFHYTDYLKSTEQLTRMQWAEALTCPAKRVQAFFTSWTGQKGRYNVPGAPGKWNLRCDIHFDDLYFTNLLLGRAYNPLDAIALAIFARGDSFYQAHAAFVARLHTAEDTLKHLIQEWLRNNTV